MTKWIWKALRSTLGVVMLLVAVSTGIFGFAANNDTNNDTNNGVHMPRITERGEKPAHFMNYKIGEEEDIDSSLLAYETTYKKESAIVKNEIETRKEEERKAKEAAEEKARVEAEEKARKEQEEAERQLASQKNVVHNPSSSSNQATTTSSKASNTASSSSKPSSTSNTNTQQATQPKAQAKAAPAPAPSIGANKIGINGTYRSYSNYGRATTAQYQSGIDAGLIVAGITNFNGNDGETTYFGGHNPGIMNFIANNIYNGAIITVTDSNGTAHKYKMIDKVDVNEYAEGVLQSIGRMAIDVYANGTGTESILVHFCNLNNNLMSFWYGVKI